jgi:signal transduction histidine kinase/CheY-like chemotaxis protein
MDIDKENNIDSELFKQTYLERSLQYITEEFFQKLRELSLIKRISDVFVDVPDFEKVCGKIYSILRDEIRIEQCSLLAIDEYTNSIVCKAEYTRDNPEGIFYLENAPILASLDDSIVFTLFKTGKPLYIKQVKKDRRYKTDPLLNGSMESVLFLPLISGEQRIGIIKIAAPEPEAFAREDQVLLEIIANQLANLFNNTQLVQSLKNTNIQKEKVLNQLQETEKQLSEYTKDLEGVVKKRTDELVQSEKLAMVGQLIAGVAHELNNPLAIIMGYVDLLLASDNVPEKISSRLEKIHQATVRCSNIVNNLLKFSRKEQLERAETHINEILKEVIELFKYQFKVNNIILHTELKNDLPTIQADGPQLQQVFLNIVSNAFDALLQQKGKKHFAVKSYTDSGYIVIEFSDTGPGISKEHRSRLFEPFFTTKEIGKGTGLGLSLSYGIIKEHNGEVYLDTSYTDGARFVVKIPIIAFELKKMQNLYPDISLDASINILIVDDETDIIEFVKELFLKVGSHIEAVTNGEEAFELIKNNSYDIIISDIKMPGKISGIDLYYAVKELKPGLEKRILFTTGDTISTDTRQFLETIDNLWMEKPFLVNDFLNVVKKCLQKNINP